MTASWRFCAATRPVLVTVARHRPWPVPAAAASVRFSASTGSRAAPGNDDSASSSTQQGGSSNVQRQAALAAALAASVAGAWAVWQSDVLKVSAPAVQIDIKPITEEVFDACDNLFVFFLDSASELADRREDIQRIIRALLAESSLSKVRFYHNIRKEGDPPPPEPSGSEPEGANGEAPLRIVMYKGQRKTVLRVGAETPTQQVVDFFKPLSENLEKVKAPKYVQVVSNASFREDVLNASAPGKGPMVLVQMYEDTCFLCFLMRPFVNSLAELLAANKAPFVIKRLNIEKNDFPDDCPISRGTPTFILFRGPDVPGSKWEEFKPKELCEKISQVFPGISEDVLQRMDELQTMVSRRFQFFTQTVMWNIELQKLETLVSGATEADAATLAAEPPKDDSDFNSVVSQMMLKDMKRIDGIVANLEHLQKEVDEVEHDAALMGAMLAESVKKRELLEEERWSKVHKR
mmetsp:Transcript_64269/g.103921  ORF Transcript_64269/g.103921 Transcript_64269/m.103921 type:complete len:463 (+) Transcript_64269:71-1459(+)